MIKTPFVATDGIIKLYNEKEEFQGLIFIERLNEPFGIALPGGFVDIGEKVEDALVREMKEEVSLDVSIESLLGVYSDPKRDSRFHTVSAVYVCKAYGNPVAADDAKKVFIYKIEDIPYDQLVFDHKEIIEDFLKKASF
jgi:8-oxo-dGTP diphosphatase